MFRFGIRDLLWLMVVVGIGLGWWHREGQMRDEIAAGRRWRCAAGMLEQVMNEDGWRIEWGKGSDDIDMFKERTQSKWHEWDNVHATRRLGNQEPSVAAP